MELKGSLCSVVSCLWKLVDVSQVGVVEDDFDSIQRLRLSYPLQLYLKGLRQFDKVLLNLLADVQLRLQPLGFVSLVQDLTF